MTKIEYVYFIRNSLQMGDKTQRFHREQVKAALNLAINTVFYEMYAKNPKVMAKSLERYTTEEYIVPAVGVGYTRYRKVVSYDIVDLPRKTGGVFGIQSHSAGVPGQRNTTTTNFVPVSGMEGEQLYGSESYLPGNVIGFSWDGARTIEFWGSAVATILPNGVHVRYIKQFNGYADTDNVVLPYGQDERIIELVRQYLGVTPPKNLVNDNADTNING